MTNTRVTMDFQGLDHWDRPVYKCVETGILYKDVTMGSPIPELFNCGNEFDGDPGFPISTDLEVTYKELYKKPDPDERFNYMLLDRLRSDCDYYLGYGNRSTNRLWADTEKEHIDKMKELHNSFSDDKKPQWLTYEQILNYEKLMVINA